MAHHATSGGKKTRTTHTLNRHTLTRRAPTAEASQNAASCVLQTTTARSQLNALDETLRLAWRAKTCFTPSAFALADGRKQNLSYLLRQVNTECSLTRTRSTITSAELIGRGCITTPQPAENRDPTVHLPVFSLSSSFFIHTHCLAGAEAKLTFSA